MSNGTLVFYIPDLTRTLYIPEIIGALAEEYGPTWELSPGFAGNMAFLNCRKKFIRIAPELPIFRTVKRSPFGIFLSNLC
jgi:hypothetical protein